MPETLTPLPAAAQHAQLVRTLYQGLLGREADAAGLHHWCGALAAGADLATLTAAIVDSEEYRRNAQRRQAGAVASARLAERCRAAFGQQALRIVDVGAQMLADEAHVYAALTEHGLRVDVIGFEPLEDKLSERARHDGAGSVRLYPHFIGDGQRHTFHINAPDATSSLLPFNRALTDQLIDLSQLRTERTEAVDTSRLDDVLDDGVGVDFLKLDIQGFELPALRHAGAVLARTNVVHCEVSFAEIYAGQGLFSDIEQLLRAQGFDFLDFHTSCRYAYEGGVDASARDRLGWGDAIFFKRAHALGRRDLLAQAAIALLIYDKPSLAAALAAQADAATLA